MWLGGRRRSHRTSQGEPDMADRYGGSRHVSSGDANIRSCPTRPRSCTPTSTPSMRRSSSGMTRLSAAARSSSGPASCSRPATRRRPSGSAPRWADRRLAGCARRRSSFARGWTPTARRARRCSRCSTGRRRSSRGCRSTRPSSTSADCGGSRARPPRSPCDLRRDVLETVGLPVTVGVARTKFLAKVASGVAKPDGLLVVPTDGELEFLHPLPVERLWGVGPVTAAKLRDRSITTVAQVARLGEATLVRMLGRAAGRHLHALAHNRDPRPVQVGRRRRSMGTQRALGRRPQVTRRRSTPTSSRWSTASRAGCERLTACAAPSCSGCGSTTSRARRGRTRCRRRPRTPRRSSPSARGLARDGHADDPASGHHPRSA